METVMVDKPFVFLSETDFDKWSHIDDIDNRFNECNIPESQLKIMTTEALLKSILHYPLNYLIFATTNPFKAIDYILEHSSLHKEFVERQDAVNAILNIFEETVVSFEETTVSKDYTRLTYIDEMFLEYFIASDYMKFLLSPEGKASLKRVVKEKIEERMNDKRYSYNSIEPLIRINDKEKLGITIKSYLATQEPFRSTTIYTYFGKVLYGDNRIEFSENEIASLTDCFTNCFPYATLVSPASNVYNCHSYAWYNSTTSNTVWLEPIYNNVFQLGRYWTNDLYISCSESLAEKIYYYNGDHSAIKLSSGNYISKWGQGPLMEHAPDYGPIIYNMTYRDYFRERTDLPLDVITITGNSIIHTNELNNYYRGTITYGSFNYVWSVEYWNDSTNPYTLQQVLDDQYQLTCYDYGIYTIRVDAYFNGNLIAYGELNINCIP
jgi:hypothetical protein